MKLNANDFRESIGLPNNHQVTRCHMRGLTISQPFASLIASGKKWIENRRWPTQYRGKLLIHAGKGTQYLTRKQLEQYPTGCAVAVARLTACFAIEEVRRIALGRNSGDVIPGTKKTWGEAADHEHAHGPYCWIIEDVRETAQVPMRGALGLWMIDWRQ